MFAVTDERNVSKLICLSILMQKDDVRRKARFSANDIFHNKPSEARSLTSKFRHTIGKEKVRSL
jgi:hypothetical protein